MRNILIFSSILILHACIKYIDTQIPDNGRKLVVNCLYSDTGILTIELFKSKHILDDQTTYNPISNAQIAIYQNDTLREQCIEVAPGLYKTQFFIPRSGQKQKMIVSYNEGETIHVTSYLPTHGAKMIFLDTTLIKNEMFGNYYLRFKFRILSNQSKKYFLVHFPNSIKNDKVNEQWYLNFETSTPIFEVKNSYVGIFSSETFLDGSCDIIFDFDAYYFSSDSINKLYFELITLSEDAYHYMRTVLLQQEANLNPFAEPVLVYSNVKNGFGIFAGFVIYRDSVLIPRINLPY